jgi:hypothetical protein
MDSLKEFTQNDLQKCFHAWKERMQHCIAAQGNYYEGDNLQHTYQYFNYNIFYENSLVI